MRFALRALEWPQAPPVDMLREFPWVVADPSLAERDKQRLVTRKRQKDGEQQVSPLKQRLVRPKPERAALSPARQAAKAMLELKAELQRIELPQSRLEAERELQGSTKQVQSKIKSNSSSPSKQLKVPGINVNRSPGKSRQKLAASDADLLDKQQRLMRWLARHASSRRSEEGEVCYSSEVDARVRTTVTPSNDIDNALWTDPVRSLLAAEIASEIVLGGFIPTRRLAFNPSCANAQTSITQESSNNLIPKVDADDNASVSALSTDNGDRSSSTVERDENKAADHFATELARDIKERAIQQVLTGSVEDALATLQTGIQKVMYEVQSNHEQLRAEGFNFSTTAHVLATKVQMRYRERHRKRIQKIVLLQRMWRQYHASSIASKTQAYEHIHAATIQRPYRRRYIRIVAERSATRIQKCFRIYYVQKHIQHFHVAVRLLLQRERHRKELAHQIILRKRRMWSKLKLILRVLRLWKLRRDGITGIQKRWKARKCRARYNKMLEEVRRAEADRRRGEDEYVASHTNQATDLYRKFLHTTSRGKYLVRLHAEYPWLHFRWLRRKRLMRGHSWGSLSMHDKVVLLGRMYCGRTVSNYEGRVIARELLRITTDLPRYQHVRVSASGLRCYEDLAQSSYAKPTSSCLAENTLVGQEKRSRMHQVRDGLLNARKYVYCKLNLTKQQLICKVSHLTWRAWYYPKAYYLHHRILKHRSLRSAVHNLERNFRHIVTGCLQVQYRSTPQNAPKFECNSCYEPFATTKELFDHLHGRSAPGKECALRKARAENEWRALMELCESVGKRNDGWLSKRFNFFTTRSNSNCLNDIDSISYRKEDVGWAFDHIDLGHSLPLSFSKESHAAASARLLVDILGALVGGASGSNFKIPLEIAGYVFLGLGGFHRGENTRSIHSPVVTLLHTAPGQPVQWTRTQSSHTIMSYDLMEKLTQKRSNRWQQRMEQATIVVRKVGERGIQSFQGVRMNDHRKRGNYQPVYQEDGVRNPTERPPQDLLLSIEKRITVSMSFMSVAQPGSSATVIPV